MRLQRTILSIFIFAGFNAAVGATENLFECQAESVFSLDKGERPSDTRYVFQYDAEKLELVKLQEGDRPIAILVNYKYREDAVQVYCERYDRGTYWTLQLTKAGLSFLETIGEYQDQVISAPLSSLRGKCVKRIGASNYSGKDDDTFRDTPKSTTDERSVIYGFDYDPNWRETQRAENKPDDASVPDLWKSVFESQQACREENPTLVWHACWERALPEKCGALVYQDSAPTGESIERWYICTLSCIDAGFWSRNFGECSREFVTN